MRPPTHTHRVVVDDVAADEVGAMRPFAPVPRADCAILHPVNWPNRRLVTPPRKIFAKYSDPLVRSYL